MLKQKTMIIELEKTIEILPPLSEDAIKSWQKKRLTIFSRTSDNV
jgi:hypothetical protein